MAKDSQLGSILIWMLFESESNWADMLWCPQYGRMFLLAMDRIWLMGVRILSKISILLLIFIVNSLQKSSGLSIASLILSITSEKKRAWTRLFLLPIHPPACPSSSNFIAIPFSEIPGKPDNSFILSTRFIGLE